MEVVSVDPEIMGGTPVFAGTRVPVETLLDYIKSNQPLDAFLGDFPTVSHEQAIRFLESAEAALVEKTKKLG